MRRVQKWTGGKPTFLSEFHWCSPKDSGLPGGKEVASQRKRGLAYRTNHRIYDVLSGEQKPFSYDNPRFQKK